MLHQEDTFAVVEGPRNGYADTAFRGLSGPKDRLPERQSYIFVGAVRIYGYGASVRALDESAAYVKKEFFISGHFQIPP